jgi:hypothetical protein
MLAAADHVGGDDNAALLVLDRLDGRTSGDAAQHGQVERIVGRLMR